MAANTDVPDSFYVKPPTPHTHTRTPNNPLHLMVWQQITLNNKRRSLHHLLGPVGVKRKLHHLQWTHQEKLGLVGQFASQFDIGKIEC